MKKALARIVVLAGIAAAAGWYYHSHHGRVETALTLYGNVDIREVNLGFRVGGRLSKLACDEGDLVKAGDVIACLDAEPYSTQLASARAQVESLQARLKLRETGNRPQEIAQARALVSEREVTAANAGRIAKRSAELLAAPTLDDAVKVNIYLTDLAHFGQVNEAMARYFKEPYPARAAVGVKELPRGALVEADAVLVMAER